MRGMPRARHALVVDVGAALNLVGALLKYLALAFLFPIPIAEAGVFDLEATVLNHA